MTPEGDAVRRLELYRGAAQALNRLFRRWAAPFCADCLEVTRRHHRGDPRADVELVEGLFPGCCHAGVGDALWVPGCDDGGRFPEELERVMVEARGPLLAPGEPLTYRVRERQRGEEPEGVACRWFRGGGCRLGDLKAPLCLSYLCDPVQEVFAQALGGAARASPDDFCGSREALRAIVRGSLGEAREASEELVRRARRWDRRLSLWSREAGETPYEAWKHSEPFRAGPALRAAPGEDRTCRTRLRTTPL